MTQDNSVNVKRVNIENLKVDMILANNVATEDGIVLFAKNTMINNISYSRLADNNIKYVYVFDNTIVNKSTQYISDEEQKELRTNKTPVEETVEFKAFEDEYEKKTEEVKSTLLDISDGGEIDLEQLYTLTEGVMSQLKYKSDIFNYLNFLKDKDEHTYAHSANVSLLANLFGKWLNLPEDQLVILTSAASLHDLGKTKIADAILNKKGALTDDEFEIMKMHSVYGYRIMQNQDIPAEVKYGALMHHEKIDGTGYPVGLKGDKISEFSKIISICDIYDAMTANRIYRGKLCPFDVIRSFEHKSYGLLDTAYLNVFLQNIAFTYVGSWVQLADGREAEVVFINPNHLSAPIIRVNGVLVDSHTDKTLKIISVI